MLVPSKHDRITYFCDSIDKLGPVLYSRLRLAADTSEASYRDFCSHAGSGSLGRTDYTVPCIEQCIVHVWDTANSLYQQYSGIQCTRPVQCIEMLSIPCYKGFLFLFLFY